MSIIKNTQKQIGKMLLKPYIIIYTSEGKVAFTRNEWMLDRTPRRYHRTDGPAIEYSDGGKAWWIDGKRYIEEEYNELIQEVKDIPLVLKLVDPRKWVREFNLKTT